MGISLMYLGFYVIVALSARVVHDVGGVEISNKSFISISTLVADTVVLL